MACGGMLYSNKSSGSSKMVTNAKLAKEVDEKNNLIQEKTILLDEAIEEMKDNYLKEMEDEDFSKGKEKVSFEDEILELDPPLGEQEPFLKALKEFGGKILENVSLFHGKIDAEVVLEWLESNENYFKCERTTKAQKVRFAKSRLKGRALTWWKFVQEERESEGKKPIANWKAMVAKIKETYFLEDYEI